MENIDIAKTCTEIKTFILHDDGTYTDITDLHIAKIPELEITENGEFIFNRKLYVAPRAKNLGGKEVVNGGFRTGPLIEERAIDTGEFPGIF